MDSVNYSWIKLKSSTIDIFLALQLLTLSETLLVLTTAISEHPRVFSFYCSQTILWVRFSSSFEFWANKIQKAKVGISKSQNAHAKYAQWGFEIFILLINVLEGKRKVSVCSSKLDLGLWSLEHLLLQNLLSHLESLPQDTALRNGLILKNCSFCGRRHALLSVW